jgi:flagellar basal body-associated protein FliL
MNLENNKLVPGEEDENVGGDAPKKKKEKKRKSKEERIADRKIVFWVLIVLVIVTSIFYLYPKIKNNNWGEPNQGDSKSEQTKGKNTSVPWQGYTEVKF